ncbi:MAG: hypothetical protein WCG75_08155 [Armatimonadota bacterium]
MIHTPKGIDRNRVEDFLTRFRFKNLSFQAEDEAPSSAIESAGYCINVIDGQDDLKAKALEQLLNVGGCSLLVFNPEARELTEPKVIFATDHSTQATLNLEKFKQLQPAGFAGATVISEAEPANSAFAIHERTRKFLEQTKSAAQATQANLIIANFDLKNFKRNAAQAANLVKMVLQNQCHVLILKS